MKKIIIISLFIGLCFWVFILYGQIRGMEKQEKVARENIQVCEVNEITKEVINSYAKHKKIEGILQTTSGKNWINEKPTPCMAASKELKEKLDKAGILSIMVDGVVENCPYKNCGHRVVFIGVEPQLGTFINIGEFKYSKLVEQY